MAVIENSTFESNQENLITWFSTTVTRINTDAHGGSWCLNMTTDAAFGSGLQLDNYPYYAASPGTYDFSVWYRETVATMPTITWRIWWLSAAVALLQDDFISMPRATSWTEATGTFTAPAGTATVQFDFQWSAAAAGPAWRLDDILIEDAVTASPGLLVPRRRRRFPVVHAMHWGR